MLRLKQCIIFSGLTLCLIAINAPFAHAENTKPKLIQLEYDVSRNGKLFGKVQESFKQNGQQYHVESITNGLGVYALLGERKLISTGTLTQEGLKPSHFELHQGNNERKKLITDFNWTKNILSMQVKGKTKLEKLEKGTQDLASYVYQFMFNPPRKSMVNVTLTTGKKLDRYQYKVLARGLKVADYKTLHISNEATAGEEKKQLWLAEDHYYLPVRYQLTDENGDNFEQILTKIHVE